MAASGSGGSLMNAPGGGGDAGGSLPACVERPVLRTTWTKMNTTCVKNVLVRTGHTVNRLTIEWMGGGNKKRNPVLFTKDRTPI